MEIYLFAVFASVAALSALGVIALRNPVYSALCLAVTFVALAALYVMLSAPFIAAAQVMIYAGAILILFLFVIMLLSSDTERGVGLLRRQRFVAIFFGLALILELGFVVGTTALGAAPGSFTPEKISQIGDTQAVGLLLFSDFLLPFEMTSLLLLVAIVGVVVLTNRSKAQADRRRADAASQDLKYIK
jgi:NADH-quinone oxidoreductase subunit J